MLLPIQQQNLKVEKTPAEEGRFGFGTTGAFDAFLKKITEDPNTHEVNLVVNIATLLRNNISTSVYIDGRRVETTEKPKLDAASVVAKTQQHMVEMANEFANVCALRFKDRTHHILFYLTDVTKQVPVEWQRPRTSESAIKLQTVTTAFTNKVKPSDQVSNNTQLHIRLANQMRVPSYKGIAEQLKQWSAYTTPVHMISHEPLDYHVCQASGRSGFLYRSPTGAVVPLTPSDLGKVVFKEDEVPFYTTTHILLGDKTLIKGCLDRVNTTRFLQLANTERWGLRTNEYITIKVKENGISIPYAI